MIKHSLLDEQIISVLLRGGVRRRVSLPELITLLLRDQVLDFERLQPHQQQPWHCLLVQLAALASARLLQNNLPLDATQWEKALLELSGGVRAAWALVVEDLALPAFMQPPVPEGSLSRAGYRDDLLTPDLLDVLITSKNHDVKMQRIVRPEPEHWLFALVTLQTTGGFLGAGNYGIVRAAGYGNRPMLGLTPELSPGVHFRRDVEVLLEVRSSFADRYDLEGPALLWLLPWDGKKQSAIPLKACDPFFIEICRRVRLLERDGQIVGLRANTAAARIAPPADYGGVTGDPWMPVEKKAARALAVDEGGFTYELLQRVLLSDEFEQPPALHFREDEKGGAYLVARVLSRGQGKTGGLHLRVIPLSRQAAEWLADAESRRALLGRLAQERVQQAAEVRRKVLYPALALLLGQRSSKQIKPWLDAFDRAVDAHFFEYLWAALDQDEKTARRAWERLLLREARRQFTEAQQSIPVPSGHLWERRAGAHALFEAGVRKVLPHATTASVT